MRHGRMWDVAVSVLVAAAWVASLAGCSSDKKTAGEKRAQAAVTGLKETRNELVTGRAQIEKTIAAMNAMRDEQGSLATEFAAFNEEVKKTEAQANKTRARAADMRARSAQYQTKWREEMAKVDDPTLVAAANERVAKVKERYEGIRAKADEARKAYDSLIQQLKSLQTYLSNDLTPAGIKAVSPVFDKAAADAKTVTSNIDAVVAELDSVASTLTPSGTTPPPAKK